jgi:hypothetical protein
VAEGERFDDEAEQLVETARILDEIGGVSV